MSNRFTSRPLVAVLVGAGVVAGSVTAVSALAAGNEGRPIAKAVLESGVPVKADSQLTKALGGPLISEYGPDTTAAARLDVGGAAWVVTPADGDGLCLQIPTGAATCGTGEDLKAGKLAITTLDAPPAADAARYAAALRAAAAAGADRVPADALPSPTKGLRTGIAPTGTATVRVLARSGRPVGSAPVDSLSGAYSVGVGLEGVAQTIEFRGSGGGLIAATPAL